MYLPDLPGLLVSIPRNPVTAVGVPLVFGMMSGRVTRAAVVGKWYKSLNFPPGRPPSISFSIVWSILYSLMGYASHLAVHSVGDREVLNKALWLYYTQLSLNFMWSTVFFGKKEIGWALVDSLLITGTSISMTLSLHGPTNGKTTWLLLPYCAWLSYATYINAGTWWLNRGRRLSKED